MFTKENVDMPSINNYTNKISVKYGDQLGMEWFNCPLFDCNHKVLEDFFEF